MVPPWIRAVRRRVYAAARVGLSAGAAWGGGYRLASRLYGGLGVVFTLHRVFEPGRPLLWPGFSIHADTLDRILESTRRLGWEAIPLDEVHRRLTADCPPPRRRFVSFTLDDGYRDNLERALPVFRRHGVPLCVYVTTGLVDRSAFYWWGALHDLVERSDRVEWEGVAGGGSRVFPARTWDEKRVAYDELGSLCYGADPEQTRALLRRYRVDWAAALDRDVLTREQVRALAADPLVTIGAHGMKHERLAPMSETAAFRELAEGRRILEGWIGGEVRHLAYPYGGPDACGPREYALAQKAGFATAFTVRRANLRPEHRAHLTCLPRREIPVDVVRLRNALSGVEDFLRYGRPAGVPAPCGAQEGAAPVAAVRPRG